MRWLLEGRDREWGHQGGISMQWKQIEEETAMPAEDLGTWLNTVGIEGREEGWSKKGDQSMEGGESRKIMNIQTI